MHFTFRSVIHLELILMKSMRSESRFFCFTWMFICWKDYLCSTVPPSLLCQRAADVFMGFYISSSISGALFCSIDLFVCFFFYLLPISQLTWLLSPYSISQSLVVTIFQLWFSLSVFCMLYFNILLSDMITQVD